MGNPTGVCYGFLNAESAGKVDTQRLSPFLLLKIFLLEERSISLEALRRFVRTVALAPVGLLGSLPLLV